MRLKIKETEPASSIENIKPSPENPFIVPQTLPHHTDKKTLSFMDKVSNNVSLWYSDFVASNPEGTRNNFYEDSNCSSLMNDFINVNKTIGCHNELFNLSLLRNGSTQINNFYYFEGEQLTFLSVLLLIIVIGNTAVLVAMLMSKKRKTRMNFFITQLAIADLLVGLISVLTDIAWKITVSWNAGNIGCKVIRYFQATVTYSSTYVLVALSIDRYDAITHPMNFCGSWKRARHLVELAWVLSFSFSIPILYLYELKTVDGTVQCWIHMSEDWQWQLYMTLVAITLFVLPAFIISACYAVIVYTIWSKSKDMSEDQSRGHERTYGYKSSEESDNRRVSSRGIIPKAKIKSIKMTFVIVFVFILCWSPYIIFDLLQVYGYIPDTQTNIAIATFMQSLAPLNSAANPIIYCFFSTHMCTDLRKFSLKQCLQRIFCPCHRGDGDIDTRSSMYNTKTYTTTTRSSTRSSLIRPRRMTREMSRPTKVLVNGHFNTVKKKPVKQVSFQRPAADLEDVNKQPDSWRSQRLHALREMSRTSIVMTHV